MAAKASLANLKPFAPGETGNPGGKPVGARNRLQGKFLAELADDFEAEGKTAIVKMRETDPSAYIRAIASLMPKEMEIRRPLEELTDDDIAAGIAALSKLVASGAQSGAKQASRGKPAKDVPPLH